MKMMHWNSVIPAASWILAAGLLLLAGCEQKPKGPQPTVINGVEVDLAKFQQAFLNAAPEVQTSVSRVHLAVRYGQYAQAEAMARKIVHLPGLTEAQQAVAQEVHRQLQELVRRTPTRPPP